MGEAGRGVFYLYSELWRLANGKRALLVAAMLLLVGAQCVLLAIPFAAGHAINALQMQNAASLRDAGGWLLVVLAVTAGSWLLHGPGRIFERNVALAIRSRVAGSLTDRLLSLPLSWHEAHHSAATAHRVQQSSQAVCAFAQSQFIYLNSVVRLVGPIVALWLIEPLVGLVAVAGFVVICASVIGFDRAMIRLAREENDAERRYSSALVDTLSNVTSLFALRQRAGVTALLARRLGNVFAPLRRTILLNEAKWCVVDVSTRALSCGLVALFAWLAIRDASLAQQTLMLGSVYMVWEYAVQSAGVVSSVASHFQTFARQQADYASADVIGAGNGQDAHESNVPGSGFCNESGGRTRSGARSFAPPSNTAWTRCEIRDLVFRHDGARQSVPTLDHVCLSLERGKRYALVGGSGSGKSTLLRVLAGLYEGERIVLDQSGGPAILSPAEGAAFLRTMTTLIPQDAEVFEGTLGENLALCSPLEGTPSSAQYARALALARVTEFVDLDRDGLHSCISERGANWSGGQRARVALARGIIAAEGSSLVLLDEPTASLDSRTEAAVYDGLFTAFAEACVISSIHRLNLLDRFDEVIVMHAGRVVAQGPATVLAATSPDFRQLVAAHRHEGVRTAPSTAPAMA